MLEYGFDFAEKQHFTHCGSTSNALLLIPVHSHVMHSVDEFCIMPEAINMPVHCVFFVMLHKQLKVAGMIIALVN